MCEHIVLAYVVLSSLGALFKINLIHVPALASIPLSLAAELSGTLKSILFNFHHKSVLYFDSIQLNSQFNHTTLPTR